MGDQALTTNRAAFTTQALATMGVDPEWDRKVADYLRLEALQFAHSTFGPLDIANDELLGVTLSLENKFGKNFRRIPQAAAAYDAACEAFQVPEKEWTERYLHPYWDATDELAAAPAPTLAAALFKVQMIYWEDLNIRTDVGDKVFGYVEADMTRLTHAERPT